MFLKFPLTRDVFDAPQSPPLTKKKKNPKNDKVKFSFQ